MKRLEVIYTKETREMIKNDNKTKFFKFHLIDLDLITERPDIAVALIRINKDEIGNSTMLDKIIELVEGLYSDETYVIKFDRL